MELTGASPVDKIIPDWAHLKSFLCIFANHGFVYDTTSYAHTFQTVNWKRQVPVPPHITELDQQQSKTVPQNATVKYLGRLVHENVQRTKSCANAEWLQFVKMGRSHRLSTSAVPVPQPG